MPIVFNHENEITSRHVIYGSIILERNNPNFNPVLAVLQGVNNNAINLSLGQNGNGDLFIYPESIQELRNLPSLNGGGCNLRKLVKYITGAQEGVINNVANNLHVNVGQQMQNQDLVYTGAHLTQTRNILRNKGIPKRNGEANNALRRPNGINIEQITHDIDDVLAHAGQNGAINLTDNHRRCFAAHNGNISTYRIQTLTNTPLYNICIEWAGNHIRFCYLNNP